MKFINFAIVKFSLFLTLGILSARFFPEYSIFHFYIILPLLLALCIIWLIAKKQLFPNAYFGTITFICFFLIGHISYQFRLPNFQNNHYSHILINDNSTTSETQLIQLKIKEVLKSDSYNSKYIASIINLNKVNTKGSILLNLRKDTLINPLTIDEIVIVSASIENFQFSLNPHQFDYPKYMETLGVHHQIRISNDQILQKIAGVSTLRGKAEKVRNHIISKLKESPLTPNELSIIQALILGQKKDISKEIYQDYAAAGAIHILAVSGLHVGIVYFILLFLFKPITHLPYGDTVLSILVVICLWGYAFITGLSPSVIRAVTMFTFFAFATIIDRRTNSINTLFLSYFVLLLINPFWLFHVGFQLSYLAVFFILWILPVLNKLYYPKNRIVSKLWGIFTVTIAAQLGIIPLSLYYFHQFPGLFFVTNIVVLPFLGILLGGGILIIVLASFNILPYWIAFAYNHLIKFLNNFIGWVAKQDSFIFQDIHFSTEKVLGSYLLIITSILLLKKRTFQRMTFSLLSIALLLCVFIWDDIRNSENQLIIFHKTRHSLIGNKNSKELVLFRSDSTFNYKNNYPLKGYRVAQNVNFYSEEKLPSAYKYKNKTVLIIDSLGVYPKATKIDVVVLTFSPKVNLDRLLDSLQPKMIIADGNNYNSYVNRWQKTCTLKKINFYSTKENGAFVFK